MDKKRWVLCSIIVAVVLTVIEGIFHGHIMTGAYAATASLWRSQEAMTKLLPYGWATTLVVAFLLYYVYHKGYEGKASRLVEGLRFGLVLGLLFSLPMAVWSYITMPITPTIAVGWFAISMIDTLVAGAIIGLIYRRAA